MTTLPDIDLETIEEISAAAPCQFGARTNEPPQCPRPAEWVSLMSCGCTPMCCEPHKADIIMFAQFVSLTCDDHTPSIIDVTITRWEKL